MQQQQGYNAPNYQTNQKKPPGASCGSKMTRQEKKSERAMSPKELEQFWLDKKALSLNIN